MDVEDNESEKKICRICYSEENTDSKEAPEIKLISPCKCKGTSQYIHFSCLRQWLESKRVALKVNLAQMQRQGTLPENFVSRISNYLSERGFPLLENTITNANNEIVLSNSDVSNSNPTVQPLEQANAFPSNVKTHEFSNFCCDVCREILSFQIITNKGIEHETVDIPRPEKEPYILIERMSQGKEPKTFSIVKGVINQDTKIVIRAVSC